MYKYIYDIRYCDYKDFDTVKTSTVLDAVQEAAIRNSEQCGFGIEVLREKDVAWLLQGVNISFEKVIVLSATPRAGDRESN